jgi:peptidylprolyl isomerase
MRHDVSRFRAGKIAVKWSLTAVGLLALVAGLSTSSVAQSQMTGRRGGPAPIQNESRQSAPNTAPIATPSGTVSGSTQGTQRIIAPDAPRAAPVQKEKLNLEDTVYLDLDYGRVVIKLRPDLAPKTVARFKELVRQGFYDGLIWHRVIDGFMAQTGDPKGDGTGGSGQNQNAEFNSGKHARGAVSMARAANINSADSQFFIVLADAPHLNGQYTMFAEVVDGMDFVDQIRKGNPQRNGSVPYPDHIIRMQVAADAAKTETTAKADKPAAAKPATKPKS